jgi:exodeoxyribonuclease VII small subunit
MTDINDMLFEQAFEELNRIIAQLESNELPLDDAVKLYERGQSLSAHCEQLLASAELHIRQLNEDGSTKDLR